MQSGAINSSIPPAIQASFTPPICFSAHYVPLSPLSIRLPLQCLAIHFLVSIQTSKCVHMFFGIRKLYENKKVMLFPSLGHNM